MSRRSEQAPDRLPSPGLGCPGSCTEAGPGSSGTRSGSPNLQDGPAPHRPGVSPDPRRGRTLWSPAGQGDVTTAGGPAGEDGVGHPSPIVLTPPVLSSVETPALRGLLCSWAPCHFTEEHTEAARCPCPQGGAGRAAWRVCNLVLSHPRLPGLPHLPDGLASAQPPVTQAGSVPRLSRWLEAQKLHLRKLQARPPTGRGVGVAPPWPQRGPEGGCGRPSLVAPRPWAQPRTLCRDVVMRDLLCDQRVVTSLL